MLARAYGFMALKVCQGLSRPEEVEEGNRCELYALRDAVRSCKAFRSRAVEGDEGLGG